MTYRAAVTINMTLTSAPGTDVPSIEQAEADLARAWGNVIRRHIHVGSESAVDVKVSVVELEEES